MNEFDSPISPAGQIWLDMYGKAPSDRESKAMYNALKLGYEAGERAGAEFAINIMRRNLGHMQGWS